jgi:hypothetical protein
MGNIKIRVEPDKDFTMYVFTGKVTLEHIISAQEEFYAKSPTLFLLVDFTQTELSVLTSNNLKVILSEAEKNGHVRKGGRTAVLTAENLALGMARIYEILAEVHDLPFSVKAFGSKDEALMWLLK